MVRSGLGGVKIFLALGLWKTRVLTVEVHPASAISRAAQMLILTHSRSAVCFIRLFRSCAYFNVFGPNCQKMHCLKGLLRDIVLFFPLTPAVSLRERESCVLSCAQSRRADCRNIVQLFSL